MPEPKNYAFPHAYPLAHNHRSALTLVRPHASPHVFSSSAHLGSVDRFRGGHWGLTMLKGNTHENSSPSRGKGLGSGRCRRDALSYVLEDFVLPWYMEHCMYSHWSRVPCILGSLCEACRADRAHPAPCHSERDWCFLGPEQEHLRSKAQSYRERPKQGQPLSPDVGGGEGRMAI